MDAGDGSTAYKLRAAPDRLELLLPCVLFAVRSQHQKLMAEVAMNLHFAPPLQTAAQRIIGKIVLMATGAMNTIIALG